MIKSYMNGRTIAVAESASVGCLSKLLASESGASSFFQGGVIAYSLRQKVEILGVEEDHAQKYNCVSNQVAQEMAKGVRKLFKTDIGLSITGYADPDAHGRQYCYVGISADVGSESYQIIAPHLTRKEAQKFYAKSAYDLLCIFLLTGYFHPPSS